MPHALLASPGPLHLIPSLCCDEACGANRAALACGAHSAATLQERSTGSAGDAMAAFFGSPSRSVCGEFSDAWPLMQDAAAGDSISFCDSYSELAGEDLHSLNPENESATSLDPDSAQDLVGGAASTESHSENSAENTDSPTYRSARAEPAAAQDALRAGSQLEQESSRTGNATTAPALQEA